MKKIYTFILTIALLVNISGCASSWLDEESYGATVGIFETEEGLDALVYQIYTKVNTLYGESFWYGYFTENGTDTWLRGNNNGGSALADYKSLDAYNSHVSSLWNHCYKALWNINLFLESLETVEYTDKSVENIRHAEILTLESLFLWIIAETWGDVYLPTTTDMDEGIVAARSKKEDFYRKIFSNLEKAVTMFPATRSTEYGRIDQSVVKAFLARMYLYDEQFDKAIEMASSVINDYGYELSSNWAELWKDNVRNKEFIWTTEFSKDESFGGGKSRWWEAHAMFIDRFAGVRTELNYTGYGGCQMFPSQFYISLFDQEADLRWKEGHQWVWVYNNPDDDTSMFPDMQVLYQDTALFLYTGILTPERREYMRTRYTVYDMNDMYDENGVPKDRYTFIGMTKFMDHNRPNSMSELSGRNYPVLRLGEMYLIRAEANIRKSSPDLAAAAKDINTLRARIIAPGYEDVMTVTERDMHMDFILDERGRELAGEFQRWYDLKRTGTLMERVLKHNPDAAPNIKSHHLLRPVPQTQFDGMPDPSTLGQNPGY